MQNQRKTGDDIGARSSPGAKRAYDDAIQRDLDFLRGWEDGKFPELCCYLRVRQIRKGNPIVVAQTRSLQVDRRKMRPPP